MTDGFGTPDSPKDGFGTPSQDVTYTPRGDAEARAKVPRDQWDRYLMPHLDGAKVAKNKGFTRVSTTKKALSNQDGIRKWGNRMIVAGLALDPDLLAGAMRIASLPDGPDKNKALGKIARSAFIKGGGKDRSGKGTAFHELTEDINRGDAPYSISDESEPHLDAYYQVLAENNATILPEYMERVVLCPYNHGGALDNIMRIWNPDTDEWELCVVDLKTGRSLDMAWLEILMQLWLYANAYAMWTTTKIIYSKDDPDVIVDVEGFYEPMPKELRKDKAFVVHVPLDGTAELIEVDLSGVEQYVEAAVIARRGNKEAKNKIRSRGRVTPAPFVVPDSVDPAESGMERAARLGSEANTVQPAAFVAQPTVTIADPAMVVLPVRNQLPSPEDGFGTPDQQAQVTTTGLIPWDSTPRPGGSATEEKNPYGLDPHAYPTKDAFTQALKAAERLAKVDEMAARIRNNDSDDALPVTGPVVPAGSPTGDPAVMVIDPTHDPVTGRKKRTCGFCHKPGHVQKTCPVNPASAKYNPQVVRAMDPTPEQGTDLAPVPVGNPEPGNTCNCLGDGDWHPYSAATCTVKVADQATIPYCLKLHQGACTWTATHKDAPGQWVCSVTGKPAKQAYEAGTTAITSDPPRYGAPVSPDPAMDVIAADSRSADGRAIQPEILRASSGQWVSSVSGKPAKHTEPPSWATPAPPLRPTLLQEIDGATIPQHVLQVREKALAEGIWVESLHDGPAQARYRELLQ